MNEIGSFCGPPTSVVCVSCVLSTDDTVDVGVADSNDELTAETVSFVAREESKGVEALPDELHAVRSNATSETFPTTGQPPL